MEFAASIPNALDRAKAVNSLGNVWISEDAGGAFEFAASKLNDSVFQHFASSAIDQMIDVNSPSQSAEHLSFLAKISPEARDAILGVVPDMLPADKRTILIETLSKAR